MLLSCGGGEGSWESLRLQGDKTSQSQRKSTLNVHWKDWCWSWSSNTLATWCEELTRWKRPWCWETLKAGGEGDDREWDDWMASLTWWTWVWASYRSWWWTRKPGVLQSMSQSRTQLSNWTITTVHLDTLPNQPLSNSVFFFKSISLHSFVWLYLYFLIHFLLINIQLISRYFCYVK